MNKKIRDTISGYAFTGIWIIGFLLLTVYPMVKTIIFSFQSVSFDTTGIVTTNVLFKNYVSLFTQDLTFMVAVKDFCLQVLLYVPIIIVFSFIVAIMLNKDIKLRGLYRAIFFLPVIIMSGPVVNELFSTSANATSLFEQYGIIDIINGSLPKWLQQPVQGFFNDFILILWMSGVQILIFLSGINKIDKSMYEAARIDGANGWLAFWKITLPSVKSIIAINILYTVVTLSTFSTNPVIRRIKLDKDLVQRGYGYASAEALIYVLVIILILLLFVFLYWIFTRKDDD